MAQQISLKIAIGIWVVQGKIPKYQFQDFYIHMMDFTYPDISPKEQDLYPPLVDWILNDRKQKTKYHQFPSGWIYDAADITVSLSFIYSIEEQKEILSLIQMRDNKQNWG